jgi:EmrB/QacA subfamily drug resistance transporter
MAESLHESPLSMHSVIIAYSLTLALLIPASGWFADRIGIKRVFLLAITVFTLGSLLCALSPTLHLLIAARVLQGIGGSMLMPIGRLALLRLFPHEQYLAALSFVAVPALVGPLIGPMLGGILVQIATWHWIFLINIPVGIVGFLFTLKLMPAIPSFSVQRFDTKGFFILALAMVSISVGLDGISELGLQQVTVTLLFLLGIGSIAVYIIHATKATAPIFSLDLFKVRTFAVGLVGNMFARVGSASMPFLIPLFLQVCLGYTPFQSGFTMFPIALSAILARRIAIPLVRKFGYRKFLLYNTMLVGLSIIGFVLISKQEPDWIRLIQLIIFGAANSLQFSAMNSVTLKDLEVKGTSSGNSLFSMVQMLAMSFGVATAGALVSSFHKYFLSHEGSSLEAFHLTFICMGAITCFSTMIFAHLSPDAKRIEPVTSQVPE